MAGNVGTISVLISAEAAAFEKGLASARKSLESFAESALTATKWIAGMGSVAAGAAFAGLTALTAESLKSIDTANDLSQELQTNINDLRAFGYAAQVNGSSVEDFNNSLRKMQKTFGEAFSGDQGAQDTLTALGISMESLRGKSATDNFRTIAQAIMQIKDPAEQAAASIAVFGKSGQGMLNTFAGLDSAVSSFKNLRGEVSALDAANIALANDSMDDFKNVLGAIGDELAAKAAPYITGFLEKIKSLIGTGDALKTNVGNAFETIVKWAEQAGNAVDILRIAVAKLNLALAQANYLYESEQEARANADVSGMSKHEAGSAGDFFDWLTTPSDTYNAAADGTLEKFKADAATRAADALKLLQQAQEGVNEAERKFSNADGAKTVRDFTNEIKKLGTATQEVSGNTGNKSFDLELQKKMQAVNDKAIKDQAEYAAKVKDAENKALDAYFDALDKKAEESKKWADEQAETLKQPAELLADYAKQLQENENLTAAQKEDLLNKKALGLDSEKGVSGSRVVDRNLSIEGLRMNEKKAEQTVNDPVVASKLDELLGIIRKQSTAATVGAN